MGVVLLCQGGLHLFCDGLAQTLRADPRVHHHLPLEGRREVFTVIVERGPTDMASIALSAERDGAVFFEKVFTSGLGQGPHNGFFDASTMALDTPSQATSVLNMILGALDT